MKTETKTAGLVAPARRLTASLATLLTIAGLTLSGCGLKGDLYIPDSTNNSGAAAEQPADTIVDKQAELPVGSDAEDGIQDAVE